MRIRAFKHFNDLTQDTFLISDLLTNKCFSSKDKITACKSQTHTITSFEGSCCFDIFIFTDHVYKHKNMALLMKSDHIVIMYTFGASKRFLG